MSIEQVGELLGELCSPSDRLWPDELWPLKRLDGPLEHGVIFGHGPVRYRLAEFLPGKKITFVFVTPRIGITSGLNGRHLFSVRQSSDSSVILRHEIDAQLSGPALIIWPLAIRPLHNALIEDGFSKGRAELTGSVRTKPAWPLHIRVLRWLLLKLWPATD